MKKYEYGFYAESGEFIEIREFGFDHGKKLFVTAKNAEAAFNQFTSALDAEYCGEEMTAREVPTGHDMDNYTAL